jgi:hypothetical protein
MRRLFETLGTLTLLANIASAATYNESVNGDLSANAASPTVWVLEAGDNSLIGAGGTGTSTTDYDLISFVVPAGHQLDSITVDSYTNSGSYQSFLGIQAGSTWTTGFGENGGPTGIHGDQLLGYVLFSPDYVGADFLPELGTNGQAFGGPGFVPPLGSGSYTILLQDTGSQFTYSFTFGVSAVPEPATIGLAAVGLFGIWSQRRRIR